MLRPDPDTNAVVTRALRSAIEVTGIGVLAFVVMGNHWHLVLRVGEDPSSLSTFMQRLKSEVARSLNSARERQGGFWSERYHAIPILDEASLIERMTYVLMNPVAAGLCASLAEYPGLSSISANLGVRAACGAVDVPIELPPHWLHLTSDERARQRAWLRCEVRDRENAVKAERIRRRLPRPKAERCTRVDPFNRPQRPARRSAPRCFAATLELRCAFDEMRKAFVAAYQWASESFRAGVVDTRFPAGSFPPRLVRPLVEATQT